MRESAKDPFETYRQANARLNALIAPEPPFDKSPAALRARSEARLRDMAAFLELLGNPHHGVPIVHVAGTSGKGSTATAIASILTASGRRTLLHTSPYLQVSTEKIQINGKLLQPDTFAGLTDLVIAARGRFDGQVTYGEAWVALAALALREMQPDVAVIEVGSGGRFDLTNVVQPTLTVITSIGIDHTETLGSTLAEIAWHKAGIIKPGIPLVHAITEPDARKVIDQEIRSVTPGPVTVVDPGAISATQADDAHWSWIDPASGDRFTTGVPGSIQTLNGAIAVAAARTLDPAISEATIRIGLRNSQIAARFEQVAQNPITILDGAHNPQKIAALAPDLDNLPHPRVGVIGFLAAKQSDEMLRLLLPHLDAAVVCEPRVLGKAGLAVDQGVALVRSLTGKPVSGEASIESALSTARVIAGEAGAVIVTGSLYLCGQAREIWYPAAEIIARQTQWPEQ